MKQLESESNYRWYILALSALTNTLAVAAPSMCLSVLFNEIRQDLGLDLVQVGLIWGIASLPGIVTVLIGGAVGDYFGPKRILILACLLTGAAGALRGLSTNFSSLLATVFVMGFLTPFISMNVFKTCGLWFANRGLGLANGVLSMGMALGFLIGSLISATLLSPLLGGWRNVLFLYGGIAMALTIPWIFSRPAPIYTAPAATKSGPASLRQNLSHVIRIRNIWLLGITILGISGCVQSTLGYLPLYLKGLGWSEIGADGALSAFHTISMIFVIPIAFWSDKLGSRRAMLLGAAGLITLGTGLLSVSTGFTVWIAVCMAGIVRDGFMAIFITTIIESDGVGPRYAGTATGMVMVFAGVGSLLAPPLGNSLASAGAGLPFLFWAALTGLAYFGLSRIQTRAAQSIRSAH